MYKLKKKKKKKKQKETKKKKKKKKKRKCFDYPSLAEQLFRIKKKKKKKKKKKMGVIQHTASLVFHLYTVVDCALPFYFTALGSTSHSMTALV